MNKKTTFLVAENDFLSGVSRVLDIASTRNKRVYNTSRSGDEADKKAIFNDWFMIGNDIRGAYEQFKKEVKATSLAPILNLILQRPIKLQSSLTSNQRMFKKK